MPHRHGQQQRAQQGRWQLFVRWIKLIIAKRDKVSIGRDTHCLGVSAERSHVDEPNLANPSTPIDRPNKRRQLAEAGAASPGSEREWRPDSQHAMDTHIFA
jgi:hypothetical protein